MDISSLPDEVLEEILSYVPNDAKTAASLVCPHWFSIIDNRLGTPLKVTPLTLSQASSIGVSSLIIEEDEYCASSVCLPTESESTLGLKRPHLLRSVAIHAKLQRWKVQKILADAPLNNLVSITLNWAAISRIDKTLISKFKFPKLRVLNIIDDDLYIPTYYFKKVYLNMETLLYALNSLSSASICLPDPSVPLTLALLTNVANSPKMKRLEVSYEGTGDIYDYSNEMKQSVSELGSKVNKIGNSRISHLRLDYMGTNFPELKYWIQILGKLQFIQDLEITLGKRVHFPTLILYQVVKQNFSNIKRIVINAAPRLGLPRERSEFDLSVFSSCLVLESLELDFYRATKLTTGKEIKFPSTIRNISLSNFRFSLEQVYQFVGMMTRRISTLNLANNVLREAGTGKGVEADAVDVDVNDAASADAVNDAAIAVYDIASVVSGYGEKLQQILNRVIREGNITCFTLGRLSDFGDEGVWLCDGEYIGLSSLTQRTLHIHDFRNSSSATSSQYSVSRQLIQH